MRKRMVLPGGKLSGMLVGVILGLLLVALLALQPALAEEGGAGIDYAACESLRSGELPAYLIVEGESISGVLPAGTDFEDCGALADLYAFFGQSGTEVLIQLVSEDFDSRLVLLDDHWNVLAEDEYSAGGLNAQILTRLPYSGAYFVLAGESAWSGGDGGGYTLYFDAGEAVEEVLAWCGYGRFRTPRELDTPSAAHSGYFATWLSPAGCDPAFELFAFWANAGDTVTIDAVSSDFDPVLVLADGDLATLVEDDDSGEAKNARIQARIEETGLYHVKLQGFFRNSFGYYTLTLNVDEALPGDFGDGAPDCYALWEASAGGLVTGDVVTRDDGEPGVHDACAPGRHAYYFDAVAGDEVLLEVYSFSPRAYVALYDAGWQLLAEQSSEDGGFADIFDVLPENGRYFVVADGHYEDEFPAGYTLYLDFGPALFDRCWTPETLEIALGETVTYERDVAGLPTYCSGLSDWYVMEGTAGETITLEMVSNAFDTLLALYDENVELIEVVGSADVADEAEGEHRAVITVTLPVTGTYYFEANVFQVSEETTGTYTLRYYRE